MSYFVVGLVAITYEPTEKCHLSLFRNFGSMRSQRRRAYSEVTVKDSA